MAFANMAFEVTGEIPGLPFPLAQTKLNEALGLIYDAQLWSFQMLENGWLTPGLLFPATGGSQSSGTITTKAYNNQVIGDAVASAAWATYNSAGNLPLLTQVQIRSPYYSLYNIIGYDTTTNPPFGTFTLDRPWLEPPGALQAYMVYQAYFPVPVSDFKRFFEIRDTTNAAPLDYWTMSRKDLAIEDPQRTNFDQPAFVVPFEVDNRGAGTVNASATLGNMLYELWPHPLSILPYTFSYLRRGPQLVLPSDTVPYPLTEELVKFRAKEISCLWKEAQKGEGIKRGSGADWRFLSEVNAAEYKRCLKPISDRDRDMAELYFTRFVRDAAIGWYGQPFATINGGLNVGRF